MISALQNQVVFSQAVNGEGVKDTYSAAATGVVAVAAATDVFTLTGSATKTIRITRIQVSGTHATGAAFTVQILKRSTANSAGTSAALTAVPHNRLSPAVSATGLSYTGNPTTGTLVGVIQSRVITATTATGAVPEVLNIFDFGVRNEMSPVLIGTADVLAVNLNGATTAATLNVDITWTEEQ